MNPSDSNNIVIEDDIIIVKEELRDLSDVEMIEDKIDINPEVVVKEELIDLSDVEIIEDEIDIKPEVEVKEELLDLLDVKVKDGNVDIKPLVVNRPKVPIFFSCTECEFTTKFKWCFDDHISTNHKADPLQNILRDGEYKLCPHCTYKTKKMKILVCHIGCEHSEHVQINAKSETIHNCKKCSYSTNSKFNLKKHLSKCLSEPVPIACSCKKCCLASKSFKCSFCVQSFRNEIHLNEHLKEHHIKNQKPPANDKKVRKLHKCSLCSYSSKNFCEIKHHIIVKHTDEKNIELKQCPQCDYQAKTKHYLKKHIRCKHVKQKFKCKECSFVTKAPYLLENHVVRRHTSPEEKHIQCEFCDFRTKLQRLLKIHVAAKHERTCKKICTQCSFVAKTQSELKEHKMEHEKSV